MSLTDTALRNAKAANKPFKLADEKGLYLLVNKAGKYWRMDYRFTGKRKTLAFGVYPDVSLKDARRCWLHISCSVCHRQGCLCPLFAPAVFL